MPPPKKEIRNGVRLMITSLPRRDRVPEELPLDQCAQRVLDGEMRLLDVLAVVGLGSDPPRSPRPPRPTGPVRTMVPIPARLLATGAPERCATRHWWVIPSSTLPRPAQRGPPAARRCFSNPWSFAWAARTELSVVSAIAARAWPHEVAGQPPAIRRRDAGSRPRSRRYRRAGNSAAARPARRRGTRPRTRSGRGPPAVRRRTSAPAIRWVWRPARRLRRSWSSDVEEAALGAVGAQPAGQQVGKRSRSSESPGGRARSRAMWARSRRQMLALTKPGPPLAFSANAASRSPGPILMLTLRPRRRRPGRPHR